MKRFDFILIPLIILTAVLVYQHRSEKAFEEPPLTETTAKDLEIITRSHLTPGQPEKLLLVVLLDPMNDCPACLQESPHWVEPMSYCLDFNVKLMVPADILEEDLAAFADSLMVPIDLFGRFSEQSLEARAREGEVLKIMYSSEKGMLWSEKGNYHAKEHHQFMILLQETLAAEGCP